MGKKIREQDIEHWLIKGHVQQLQEHWLHPVVVAYRKKQIESSFCSLKARNAWFNGVRNGDTFSFLMQRDEEFKKANGHIGNAANWFEAFDKLYESSWGLLDMAPGRLKHANAVDTLDLLMRDGQNADADYALEDVVRMISAKLYHEMHGFYRRFQHQGALTAIAWMDNEDVWVRQRPRMANIMRHAASHNPNDVLGAYLVWACDAGCSSAVHLRQHKVQNIVRMQQLRLLAERVGLDTKSYDEHARQCKTLHEGLGMELNGKNVLAYVQGTTMTAAPLAPGDELGSLFL